MAEKPILFSGAMVRAVIKGSKTQTRRVVQPQPILRKPPFHGKPGDFFVAPDLFPTDAEEKLCIVKCAAIGNYHYMGQEQFVEAHCPYGKPGDRLWVRETWARNNNQLSDIHSDISYVYRADGEDKALDNGTEKPWRPSIHMPRCASRLTLEITQVRVERVQDISLIDCQAEGVTLEGDAQHDGAAMREAFRKLWDSINLKRGFGWEKNPWVWAISFRKVEAHAH